MIGGSTEGPARRDRARRGAAVALGVTTAITVLAGCGVGTSQETPDVADTPSASATPPTGRVTVNAACGVRELRWGGRWWAADPPYVGTRSSASSDTGSGGVLFLSAKVAELESDLLVVTADRLSGPVRMHPMTTPGQHRACKD